MNTLIKTKKILLVILLAACSNPNNLEQANSKIEEFESSVESVQIVKFIDTPIADKQGNSYSIIQFKNQLWSTSNYLQTVFNNGDKIKEAKNVKDWFKATQNHEPIWCYYNFDPKNLDLYGVYYNWYAINDPRGLTPEGWSVPANQQAHIFARELKFEANHLKEREYWKTERFIYNSTGFSARPGGLIGIDGEFRRVGDIAYFWTATEKNQTNAMCFDLTDEFNSTHFSDLPKELGMNIRLFKLIEL